MPEKADSAYQEALEKVAATTAQMHFENERLRAALKEIIELDLSQYQARSIARRALNGFSAPPQEATEKP